MSAAPDDVALAPVARLLGRLMVRELDAATAAELRQPEVREALLAVGITAPGDDVLEALAQRYFDLFLHPPRGLPPVQSLWLRGEYDADPAAAVRAIAVAAGLEVGSGARGAPPDQIGCILCLWAELIAERPELAARLQQGHLAWAERALAEACAASGFYGAVACAVVDLLRDLVAQGDRGP